MPSIKLNSVTVKFPIYNTTSRSLKNAMISATTGGSIGSQTDHVVIQALDNVSLTVDHGERIALIGHNGAGKTTLLRVMAGIYEPTEGVVTVEGRVTPMFDVGIGVDPESTGYENITLRGLYLGISKDEMRARMEEIARFTELGAYLHLPMRTYSAGMQARLTFAMATCIDPEVLLVDEGIGAGDAAFLEKADQRVHEFIGKSGILVLASHSIELIRRFCSKAIVMEHGRIICMTDVEEGLQVYQERTHSSDSGHAGL